MVDVDRRIPTGISPSHAAGLRRLSTRASTTTATSSSSSTARTAGLHSFAPFASSLISLFKRSSIPLAPGLSEPELIRIESHLNFTFPPDLRALLSLAVPSAPGFPDWRSPHSLPSLFHLPTVSVSLQVATSAFSWPTSSWGPRPLDTDIALSSARSNLRRAPLLVPIFGHCYLPSRPSLAGNPAFYVDEDRIFVCAVDLQDFFSRLRFALPSPVSFHGKIPRWIEFWTDASGSFRRKRSSLSSSSSSSERYSSSSSASQTSLLDTGPDPEKFVEIRPPKVPDWVGRYMDRIGSTLKSGGWGEDDVEEMVHVSASCSMDFEEEMWMDVLVLRADRWSESLRRAGWSSEEVADVLGFDLGRRRESKSRNVVTLPPEIQFKVERLAEEFHRY